MSSHFSIASGALLLFANVLYARGVMRAKTKPSAGSWITWAIVDIALIVGMIAKDTVNWQITASTAGTIVIATLTCIYGEWKWTTLEKWCLRVLPVGLALWYITDNALWNIWISLGIIFIGCFPTYEKMWGCPGEENRTAWTLAFISSLLMIGALPPSIHDWNAALAAQPIVFLLTQIPMMYLLWFPKKNPAPK